MKVPIAQWLTILECERSSVNTQFWWVNSLHYVNRQLALTRWPLWTEEVSYSWFSGFDICGAAWFSGLTKCKTHIYPWIIKDVLKHMYTLKEIPDISFYKYYASSQGSFPLYSHICLNRDKPSFIHLKTVLPHRRQI